MDYVKCHRFKLLFSNCRDGKRGLYHDLLFKSIPQKYIEYFSKSSVETGSTENSVPAAGGGILEQRASPRFVRYKTIKIHPQHLEKTP